MIPRLASGNHWCGGWNLVQDLDVSRFKLQWWSVLMAWS